MKKKSLIDSFEQTLKGEKNYVLTPPLQDTIVNILDGISSSSIPIFSLMCNIWRTAQTYQLYHLAKNIYKFLFNLQETTIEEREIFLKELEGKNKERACETLLYVLNNLDNSNKIDTLTNLVKARIREDISIDDFIRLCVVLDRIPYSDIDGLVKYTEDYYEVGSTDILLSSGVLINSNIDMVAGINKYQLNSLGILMLKYGLGVEAINHVINLTNVIIPTISEKEIDEIFENIDIKPTATE